MSEQPHEHQEQVDPNRPEQEDILQTVMEELQTVNDQRLFFKAQAKKMQRRAEAAEMAQASLQARVDQLEAEARGENVEPESEATV